MTNRMKETRTIAGTAPTLQRTKHLLSTERLRCGALERTMAFLDAILAFNVLASVIGSKWLDYVGALCLWSLKDTHRPLVMAFKATLLAAEAVPGTMPLMFLVPVGLAWPALEIVESFRHRTYLDVAPLCGLLAQAYVTAWPGIRTLALQALHAGLHLRSRD